MVDPAGNKLDGETDADQPLDNPTLSGNGFSGDGIPAGAFVGRFTVDTRPEIGVWSAGTALIDINGNLLYDPENVDASNRDINFQIGFPSDNIFAGKFGASTVIPGQASGFDTLAAYGRVGNQWRWMVDINHDGTITPGVDVIINEPMNVNGLPVAGNFDGNLFNGDEVGVFDGTRWFLDTNHDFQLDMIVTANYTGFPIVGDFNGDGIDDLGAYTAVTNRWGGNLVSLDIGRTGAFTHQFRVGTGVGGGASGFNTYVGVRERAVAADMDADGVDDIGFWIPDGSALNPGNQGEWNFLVSAGNSLLNRINNGFIAFTPIPFGPDFSARFGNSFAWPLVGNFDPPVVAAPGSVDTSTISPTPTEPASSPETIVETPPKAKESTDDVPVTVAETQVASDVEPATVESKPTESPVVVETEPESPQDDTPEVAQEVPNEVVEQTTQVEPERRATVESNTTVQAPVTTSYRRRPRARSMRQMQSEQPVVTITPVVSQQAADVVPVVVQTQQIDTASLETSAAKAGQPSNTSAESTRSRMERQPVVTPTAAPVANTSVEDSIVTPTAEPQSSVPTTTELVVTPPLSNDPAQPNAGQTYRRRPRMRLLEVRQMALDAAFERATSFRSAETPVPPADNAANGEHGSQDEVFTLLEWESALD